MAGPLRVGVATPVKEFAFSPSVDTAGNVNALVSDVNSYLSKFVFGLPQVVIPYALLPPTAPEGSEAWVPYGRKVGEAGIGTGVEAYFSNGAWRSEATDLPITAAPLVFNSMFFARETLDYALLGTGQLQYERTQPWTLFVQMQCAALPLDSTKAGILFTNVLGSLPYTGYEVWIDNNGFLRSRLINSFSGNCLSVIGSVNVITGVPVFIAVSYDGSSTPAGIKFYVNGVLDPSPTTEFNSLTGTTKAAGQFFRIGNQLGFTFGLQGYMGFFSLDNVARSSNYIANYGLSRLPINDPLNTVLYTRWVDQSGPTVTDESASGFNLMLSYPTQWAGVLPQPSTIAFDAIASGTGAAASSITATLTTAGAGELIYLFANTTSSAVPVITDTAGLTWTLRAATSTFSAPNWLYSWYAIAPAKLTGDVITMTGTNLYQLSAIAFSGQSSHPLAIPAGSTNQTTGMQWPTAPSGLMLAFWACTVATPTPGAGWTALYDATFTLIEYKTNATMIGSQTVLIGSASAGGIVEAIN